MATPLVTYYDPTECDHRPPDGAFKLPSSRLLAVDEPHPDRPERARNLRRMVGEAFPDGRVEGIDPAPRAAIERVHDPDYVDWFRGFCADGGGRIDGTTTGTNEHGYAAARYAAGAALAAADHAAAGRAGVPYALCRPSGHHAQPDRADGFCFFNNAAIAAEAALAGRQGIDRVAVVDWDVHHGNGTQECFHDRGDVLLVDVHNDHGSWDPTYHPQEGSRDEVGVGAGEGYTVNVPVPPGTGDEGYAAAFDRLVEPIVRAYDPDLLIVSAGQDPGVSDPLGRNLVTRAGFRELAGRARGLAADLTGGPPAILQEGGYQISHLAFATLGVLEGATGETVDLDDYGDGDPFEIYPEALDHAREWLDRAAAAHADHWPVG